MLLSFASPALRRRLLFVSWIALASLPAAYVAWEFAATTRNFPFWDELDAAIDFLLKLKGSGGWREVLPQFFALNNEHRTVTSRVIFALSYWLTGTVNFNVIGVIGNLFIVGACGLLVGAARGIESRIRVGVVLALLVFQLEHFENFIWSGASIDHFQVVFLGVAAIVALTRDTATSCRWAVLFAVLATFTLAHGCVVWALGIGWLTQRRAWSRLLVWSAFATMALGGFFAGFQFNPGHAIPSVTLANVALVGYFWLQLLGAPLVLGQKAFAAFPGAMLIALVAVLVARGAIRRHPVAILTACFGVASLVLVAFGRIHMGGEIVTSRYMILPALAWAMTIHVILEEFTPAEKPFRWLAWIAPPLVALNIAADFQFQKPKEDFIEARDRAATYFKTYGHADGGNSRIYPSAGRADEILTAAYQRGVYHLGRVSDIVPIANPKPSTRMVGAVDELVVNSRAVTVGGWGMLPGRVSKRGQVYLVLQTDDSFTVYSTLTLQRRDIANTTERNDRCIPIADPTEPEMPHRLRGRTREPFDRRW